MSGGAWPASMRPIGSTAHGRRKGRFPSTVTASDRDAPPIRQWPKRNDTLPKATASWLTSISKNFSTRVNHDSLMARVAAQVTDKRVLRLIRAFLKSGVMEDGLVSPVDEGTPQGGPLSPLLTQIVSLFGRAPFLRPGLWN
jgi:hypothetical protein